LGFNELGSFFFSFVVELVEFFGLLDSDDEESDEILVQAFEGGGLVLDVLNVAELLKAFADSDALSNS